MRTVLFLGAGRHQRAAILQAKEMGLRVAAFDGNPDAVSFPDADIAEVVDFVDIPVAIEAARRIRPDGVLTITLTAPSLRLRRSPRTSACPASRAMLRTV